MWSLYKTVQEFIMIAKKTMCPYYRQEYGDENYQIRCDGLTPGICLHMVFADKSFLILWREEKCEGFWMECPVAKEIERSKQTV